MERTKIIFITLACMFLLTSGHPGAEAQTSQSQPEPLVIPNTALALPAGSNVKVRWVSPPLDSGKLKKASWYSLRFAVNPVGRPWIGYQDRYIINPERRYRIELPRPYTSFDCTQDGALLATTRSDICFIVPPRAFKTTYDKIPAAVYQPIANLPAPGGRVFAGADNCVYFVADREDGGSDIYFYHPDEQGVNAFIKIFTCKTSVRAVAGNETNTFIAMDSAIVKLSAEDRSVCKIYFNPREFVLDLAYYPGTGLFYCTNSSLGYIGENGTQQIMAVPDAQIALQNGTLYVFLSKSLGVLALDNIKDLKRFDHAVEKVPVTEPGYIKITGIRFYEAGKDLPHDADKKFATEFDHNTTRFIYCQYNITNLQYQRLHHKETLTVELYRSGWERSIETRDVSWDFKPEYSSMTGWSRFGSEKPGSFYPGVYIVRTKLNGATIEESRFTVTGQPTIFEAAVNGESDTVRQLINAGADVNGVKNSYTPLMLAALSFDAETVKTLIDAGADVNRKKPDNDTALTMIADAWNDNTTIPMMLIKAGVDLNAQGKDGKTALHIAAHLDKESTVRILLEHGARTDLKDKDGLTPLLATEFRVSPFPGKAAGVINLLLDYGADASARDASGKNALFNAVDGSNVEAVSALVRHGADVNASGNVLGYGERSVLGFVLRLYELQRIDRDKARQFIEIAAILQDHGADLNISEFPKAYFGGIDRILDPRHMGRMLQMSELAATWTEPTDPYLQKADILGLLNAACRQISKATSSYDYYNASSLCEKAAERARKWGLIDNCPEISFDRGIIYYQAGNNRDARKYLNEYLYLAPTGSCAAQARELLTRIK